jgi:glucosamine 6-phosphate synthetase-like amidotransferase/phosphosugar isomerase protein
MCGVIGWVSERHREDLGVIAAELLKSLEYRGYDSTGAAIQGDGTAITLRKGVGAPSAMVHKLGIVQLPGQIAAGQVRWATFGAVDERNAQPHEVRCHTHLYGAHNGNVTNCDALQAWLGEQGHRVLSDNDGEMVVHVIEHEFAALLLEAGTPQDAATRRGLMRTAIGRGATRLQGSFAAVVVDPVARTLWAIKLGSSLYCGVGSDDVGGRFGVASSDLSSVLKRTRAVVPLAEGEFVELDGQGHQVFALDRQSGVVISRERPPVRSRLRAEDTALAPEFTTFMAQEIAAQESTVRHVVEAFAGGPPVARALAAAVAALSPDEAAAIHHGLEHLRDQYADAEVRRALQTLADGPALGRLAALAGDLAGPLASSEAGFFAELASFARDDRDRRALAWLDGWLAHEEQARFAHAVAGFCERVLAAQARGGRLYVLCCGSSFHAAKAGALFFNEIAQVELLPLLPGEFRAQAARSLRDGDLVLAVSQSGETKDLIDVVDDVLGCGRQVAVAAMVNNVNSTLAQEKAEITIPLGCGPEIAVAATKSFMNQLAMFHGLAIELASRRGAFVDHRSAALASVPELLARTLRETAPTLDEAADLLFLAPSLHLLAIRISAVAREGALKIREVVLCHAEGFEGSEFKHGPNTILGRSTVFGPRQVERLLAHLQAGGQAQLGPALFDALFDDYPLLYVTGPDERDVLLAVSQMNTHKIRGASTVVVAEEHPALRTAAGKPPADNPHYRHVYVPLPATGDTLLTVYSSTLVLQQLALRMSEKKAAWLDALGVQEHGVHPDVPKNVSKSITVD